MSKILNPATNRYVNRHGKIGRKILEQGGKQGDNQLNLPPDVFREVKGVLPYNRGTFIRDNKLNIDDRNVQK